MPPLHCVTDVTTHCTVVTSLPHNPTGCTILLIEVRLPDPNWAFSSYGYRTGRTGRLPSAPAVLSPDARGPRAPFLFNEEGGSSHKQHDRQQAKKKRRAVQKSDSSASRQVLSPAPLARTVLPPPVVAGSFDEKPVDEDHDVELIDEAVVEDHDHSGFVDELDFFALAAQEAASLAESRARARSDDGVEDFFMGAGFGVPFPSDGGASRAYAAAPDDPTATPESFEQSSKTGRTFPATGVVPLRDGGGEEAGALAPTTAQDFDDKDHVSSPAGASPEQEIGENREQSLFLVEEDSRLAVSEEMRAKFRFGCQRLGFEGLRLFVLKRSFAVFQRKVAVWNATLVKQDNPAEALEVGNGFFNLKLLCLG